MPLFEDYLGIPRFGVRVCLGFVGDAAQRGLGIGVCSGLGL